MIKRKIIIEYCEQGESVSDFEIDKWMVMIEQTKEYKFIQVSTELPIHAIRLMVLQNKIDHTEVVFRYNDEEFQCDKNGRINQWPNGFADKNMQIISEILDIGTKNYKRRKNLMISQNDSES